VLVSVMLWALGVLGLAALGPDLTAVAVLGDGWSPLVLLGRQHPDQLLVLLVGGIAWVLLAWLALGWLAVLGSAGTGRLARSLRLAVRILLPAVVRRGLETAMGLGVAVVTASPALAAPAGTPPPVPDVDRVPVTSVQLTPVPQVPEPVLAPAAVPAASPGGPMPSAAPPPSPSSDEAVVVHRGDCLWSVIARALGPAAADEQVAEAWPHWYAANRAVIGDDPALLLPGQVLTPPS
jgi:hypothetical protein